MRYYVTIDTNVLVSALFSASSVPGRIVEEAMRGSIIPLYNDEILAEYDEVLHRQKFRFDRDIIKLTIETIIRRGVAVDAGPIEDVLPDSKDVVFYEVTMEKRKTDDAYLVTGNLKHFPQMHFVVTPREMLDIIHDDLIQPEEDEET